MEVLKIFYKCFCTSIIFLTLSQVSVCSNDFNYLQKSCYRESTKIFIESVFFIKSISREKRALFVSKVLDRLFNVSRIELNKFSDSFCSTINEIVSCVQVYNSKRFKENSDYFLVVKFSLILAASYLTIRKFQENLDTFSNICLKACKDLNLSISKPAVNSKLGKIINFVRTKPFIAASSLILTVIVIYVGKTLVKISAY